MFFTLNLFLVSFNIRTDSKPLADDRALFFFFFGNYYSILFSIYFAMKIIFDHGLHGRGAADYTENILIIFISKPD
jgi:hypothetical protein